MSKIDVGDIVARKSYNRDIFFKVVSVDEDVATLKGISYRIMADADLDDLEIQQESEVNRYYRNTLVPADRKISKLHREISNIRTKRNFLRSSDNESEYKVPGRILHIDGDEEYLEICLEEYRKLDLTVYGKHVPERKQPDEVYKYLKWYSPEILVLTGHDSITRNASDEDDVRNYRNSKYFIEAVKEARKYDRSLDNLVIFAGACQSMYSEIIKAGANFASSPGRILIHALDPVMICQIVAYFGADGYLKAKNVINNTISGKNGIGGITTKGQFREIYPVEIYKKR